MAISLNTDFPITITYNIPASQNNRLSEIRYSIYDWQGTVIVSPTNSGIIETKGGKYGVKIDPVIFGNNNFQGFIYFEMIDGSYPAQDNLVFNKTNIDNNVYDGVGN